MKSNKDDIYKLFNLAYFHMVWRMRPEPIPELKGKVAREFEARIREPLSSKQKWILKEASRVYKSIKEEK
jgi:hypothetical protein